MAACAPISGDSKDPEPNPDISFSVTAVASSVELEVNSIPAVTDVGGVIRLATEDVPTKAEAQVSKGYVSLSIDAGSTRKFSISQHYGSNFEDGGFTLADVLAPNRAYKLYLYMPTAIDLGQTVIKGGEIKENRVEISFTTASLPLAGDTVWSEKFTAREFTASLNEYHFMESQAGVIVAYFQSPHIPFAQELSMNVSGVPQPVGRYKPGPTTSTATPNSNFYYNSGLVEGYPSTATSRTVYVMVADKEISLILREILQFSSTSDKGLTNKVNIPISRY
ncbi:hypothetical protein P0082_06200 [Candidatus Haliotispira prima]|uniref:Lipoprotein n=1 Tax=Candidatus Haliotispira prima TaxID=3034016 RepID=A0ABY8MDS4_9SPIO|nr:hypothetical protein P0082_06200 [Candidatus Haliotispira prima]